MNFNQLTNIDALIKFKKMKTIYCLSNNLTSFPASLCALPLKVLSIGQNKIKKFPPEFQQLRTLEIIRFDSNGVEEFPLVLTQIPNLREVYANNNSIRTIPPAIGSLLKLRLLKIDFNKLESLPQELELLGHLELLDVSRNSLREISISFRKLRKLKELFVKKNKITAVPPQLNDCRELHKLNLQDNDFPVASFSGVTLSSIVDVKLENCKIKTLEAFSAIKNVTSLRLSGNMLEQLGSDFCELKCLKVLDL